VSTTVDTDSGKGNDDEPSEVNLVRIALIGTVIDKLGEQNNAFLRTLETVPEIDANCFAVEGVRLTSFMRVIANIGSDGQRLSLGKYTLDDKAEAFNGNTLPTSCDHSW
jgi:hypothetical protein